MGAMRIFRIVFTKELKELLRDRKTLFWLLAPPFILPLIALLAAGFIGIQTARYITQGFPVSVVNAQAAPELMQQLKASKALIVKGVNNTDFAADNALIVLTIPDGFDKEIAANRTGHLSLTQRDNSFVTTLALGAVRSEIGTYNGQVFNKRLNASGLDSSWLTPVTVDETQNAAAAQSVTAPAQPNAPAPSAGLGSIFLPLAVTSWLIGGGLGLVVDTTVGEKERQTIENVLVTPASRLGIVLGKLSVVFLASFTVMGLWMLEGVFLSLLGDAGPKILALQSPGTGDITSIISQSGHDMFGLLLLLILLLIPFIVLLNSLVMIVSTFANSYRESNVFLFLLQLILPAMVLLSIFSLGSDAGLGWYAAPILSTIVAIRDLFTQTLTPNQLLLSVVSSAVYAIGGLALASYVYSREWALTRGI